MFCFLNFKVSRDWMMTWLDGCCWGQHKGYLWTRPIVLKLREGLNLNLTDWLCWTDWCCWADWQILLNWLSDLVELTDWCSSDLTELILWISKKLTIFHKKSTTFSTFSTSWTSSILSLLNLFNLLKIIIDLTDYWLFSKILRNDCDWLTDTHALMLEMLPHLKINLIAMVTWQLRCIAN